MITSIGFIRLTIAIEMLYLFIQCYNACYCYWFLSCSLHGPGRCRTPCLLSVRDFSGSVNLKSYLGLIGLRRLSPGCSSLFVLAYSLSRWGAGWKSSFHLNLYLLSSFTCVNYRGTVLKLETVAACLWFGRNFACLSFWAAAQKGLVVCSLFISLPSFGSYRHWAHWFADLRMYS